ncbi:MAG: hypothetical protein M3Q77_00395, partial [Thermoproteota archaeon]|nr:hypothetical protein [Thermoproteota archaeon]
DNESMTRAQKSYVDDINAGFDLLHIDTSKDPGYPERVPYDVAIRRVVDLISFLESYKRHNNSHHFSYEVSLEETVSNTDRIDEFISFVQILSNELAAKNLPQPIFITGNTGTQTRMDRNIGLFDKKIVNKLTGIAIEHNMLLKEHNADYLSTDLLQIHPMLDIKMANVGPEFARVGTDALMRLALEEKKLISTFNNSLSPSNIDLVLFNAVKVSDKWKKWLIDHEQISNFEDKDFREMVLKVNGHYFFSRSDMIEARKKLFENLKVLDNNNNPEKFLKDSIKAGIMRYVDAFKMRNLTSKIREIDSDHSIRAS